MAKYTLLAIMCNSIAAVTSSSGDSKSSQQAALHPELTRANYQVVAEAVASPQREIPVKTADLRYQDIHEPDRVLNHFRNFAYHLSNVNRLQNRLILSYTNNTCALLLGIGISCFVDRAVDILHVTSYT